MTGLRQGELAGLRWRDVDWAARLVRVRRSYSRGQWTTPKSRRSSRAVPMADRVATELERHFQRTAYVHDDDLVFCHPETGRPYDASKSRVRFKQALKRAGLRDLRFHNLRHTYGTRMAAAGTPLRTLQGWMGHRDYKTTEIYADFAPDPSQGAMWAERAFGVTLTEPPRPHHGPDSERFAPRTSRLPKFPGFWRLRPYPPKDDGESAVADGTKRPGEAFAISHGRPPEGARSRGAAGLACGGKDGG